MFADIGKINKINKAENNANTPPSLFGIDRKIAYTHRKYHSGLICTGVTRGFASKKFSGSVNIFGVNIITIMNIYKATINPNASFDE
jgi:hypothetical protein